MRSARLAARHRQRAKARQTGDVSSISLMADYLANVARLNAKMPDPSCQRARYTLEVPHHHRQARERDTLKWNRAPTPTGSEVVWRETTSPTWTFARDVGSVSTISLPISKDDYFLGVRAYRARTVIARSFRLRTRAKSERAAPPHDRSELGPRITDAPVWSMREMVAFPFGTISTVT